MSYGFEIYNSNNVLLANNTDFNYGLISSGTNIAISTQTTINYSNTGEIPIIFIRNNSTKWVACTNISTTSASFYAFEAVPTGSYNKRLTSTATIDYRVYTTFKNLPGSGDGSAYGIQILDSNGYKTFDSTYSIPLISGIATLAIPTVSDTNASVVTSVAVPAGVSTNPWINVSMISGTSGQLHGIHYNASFNSGLYRCLRVVNGYLEMSYGVAFSMGQFTTSSFGYGSGTSRLFYFLNTSANDPLSGSIGFTSGSSNCSFVAPATSCTTTESYTANYTGGNGNAVSYNWTLPTNTGGISISAGATSQIVTVTKSAGTGTYNAVLQCAISQSGSTTVNPTVNISHSHTATPITGNITYSSGSASCSYTSGGTCTSSEVYDMVTSGGDGTAKTYSWTLPVNAGSFTYSGSTTSQTVTVQKAGAAGTYTCTLRCVVTQSGINTTFELPITHTHTSGTALSATVGITNDITNCDYPDSGACNTSSTWLATPSGGNGNAITYQWSLPVNTGGLSFSGGTTAQSATVIKSASDGTYTATLRCVVSQSGSTSVTVDTTVTHTHSVYYTTCFPAGSLVMMADKSYKTIESIKAGELLMSTNGTAKIVKMDRPKLGTRKLLKFSDNSLQWSEEHAMWTKNVNDSQWWWSYNSDYWKYEARKGVIGGLFDNSTIRTGNNNLKWAHTSGWLSNTVEEVADADQNTSLYLPFTNGYPIIVNGYVVGAGINQWVYDYSSLDWDTARLNIVT